MKRLLCSFFGHPWTYLPRWSNSKMDSVYVHERICGRCKKREVGRHVNASMHIVWFPERVSR